jgi:hypothetical protein
MWAGSDEGRSKPASACRERLDSIGRACLETNGKDQLAILASKQSWRVKTAHPELISSVRRAACRLQRRYSMLVRDGVIEKNVDRTADRG